MIFDAMKRPTVTHKEPMKKATDSAKELAALLKKTKTATETPAAEQQEKDERALKLAKARAVMNAFDHVRTWVSDPDRSSTGTAYVTMLGGDGKLSCKCPGWLNYSGGTERRPFRRCKHQDDAETDLRLEGKKMEARRVGDDAYLYVIQ